MPAIFSSPVGRASSIGVLAIIAMVLSVAFSVSFISAARPRGHALTKDYSYEHYVRDFNLAHGRDEKEHTFRRAIFEKRRDEAIAHNKQGHSWTMGINQFSDRTDEELNGSLNRNYRSIANAAKSLKPTKVHKVAANTPVPHAIDYRNANPAVLTAIKDQGQCGSCWSHSATESMESHYAIVTGQLSVLSQQQVASCTPNPNDCGGSGGCQGATHQLAFDYVTKAGGITEEWMYPYISYFGQDFACKTSNKTKFFAAFDGYTQVNRNDAMSTMSALATGPLSVVVAAVPFLHYDGGVFNGCSTKNGTTGTTLDHGVQLVGYGFDQGLSQNYWIIRNSWSTSWGENGFIRFYRAPNGQSEACGWDTAPASGIACKGDTSPEWICGECGVLYDVTYPNPKPLQ